MRVQPEGAADETNHLVSILDRGEFIDARRECDRPTDRQQPSPVPAPEHVHGRAEQEADRLVHRADPFPSLPDRQVSVLHDLLRLVAVPGDEAESAEQPLMGLLEEVLEALRSLDHLRPSALQRGHRSR